MKKQITYTLFCLLSIFTFHSCTPISNIGPAPNATGNNVTGTVGVDFTLVLRGSVVATLNQTGYIHTYFNIILAKPLADGNSYIAYDMPSVLFEFDREKQEFIDKLNNNRYTVSGKPINDPSLPDLEWYSTSLDGINLRIFKEN